MSEEEKWLGLAKLAQDSFFNRREVEWKSAFGLWTAIGGITYFAVSNAAALTHVHMSWFAVGYGLLWFVLLFCWQLPLRRGFEDDKRWKHHYMHKAEGIASTSPESADYLVGFTDSRHLPWTLSQMAVTFVFLAASWQAIDSSIKSVKDNKTQKIKPVEATIHLKLSSLSTKPPMPTI